MNPIWQTLLAAVCTWGFAYLFGMRGRHLPVCAVAGGLVWAAYLLAGLAQDNYLFSNFCAAAVGTLIAETCARLFQCTATSFLVPAVIPLIPGGALFYTMEAFVRGDRAAAGEYAIQAAAIAGVIAVGVYIVSSLFRYIRPRAKDRQTEV